MNFELILAEFGERKTAGDAELPASRLDPTLSTMRKYFPRLAVRLYTDDSSWLAHASDVFVVCHVEQPPFDKRHPRYGWRCNDYYKGLGLLSSPYQFAIAMDADMAVVSDAVASLFPLADAFKFLVPVNTRWTVSRDASSKCDGGIVCDKTSGFGMAYAGTPWVRGKLTHPIQTLLQTYCNAMKRDPVRGPLALWRAVWTTNTFPYVLPPQFCVCAGHEEIHDPVIVHVGHESVRQKFAGAY